MGLDSRISVGTEAIPETDLSDLPVIRGRFKSDKVRRLLCKSLGEQEFSKLVDARVDERMVFGINPYYLALATGGGLEDRTGRTVLPDMPPSPALLALVVPSAEEAADLTGEPDPSSQNRFSPEPLKGKVVHKYDEIVLGHTALACSAHCRYCYRLDLFNSSTGKGIVTPEQLRDYVVEYNSKFRQQASFDCGAPGGRYPITEVLLSGGDPMVHSNRHLYKYLAAAAEAGVNIIRIGTKEIVFRPGRFDGRFIEMLRMFHTTYPKAHISFMLHITHPDEFLQRDVDGKYVLDGDLGGAFKWLTVVDNALRALRQLDFVSVQNQTAIIRRVNDDASALHILHRELSRKGVTPHYTFQCREIEGYRFFAVPIEAAWRIHNASQRGLTALGRSRFALSTEWGKLEVVSVTGEDSQGAAHEDLNGRRSEICRHFGSSLIVFKIHRSPGVADTQGELIIAKSNPEALWISDYEDRIVYDGRHYEAHHQVGQVGPSYVAA
jgi:L-lysine 2,3-aminomutase